MLCPIGWHFLFTSVKVKIFEDSIGLQKFLTIEFSQLSILPLLIRGLRFDSKSSIHLLNDGVAL